MPTYAPFIVVPPLTSCEKAFIVFGQGTAPFTIFPIATGSATGASLETLPVQTKAGVFEWNVGFNPGANITFALVDAEGQYAYSVFRVVQEGDILFCPPNDYTSSSPNLGAILGGVLGTAFILSLFALLYFLHRRRAKHPSSSLPSRAPTPEVTELGARAGMRRAGTFNMHNVELTEPSVDHLRQMDPPPGYIPKRASRSEEESFVEESTQEEGEGSREGEQRTAGWVEGEEQRVGRQTGTT